MARCIQSAIVITYMQKKCHIADMTFFVKSMKLE